jgi:hypothetical protein
LHAHKKTARSIKVKCLYPSQDAEAIGFPLQELGFNSYIVENVDYAAF